MTNLNSEKFSVYFVKDGLFNGEEGVHAIPTGGGDDPPQRDGWYYIVDGMDDGVGPFKSEGIASLAGSFYIEELEKDS